VEEKGRLVEAKAVVEGMALNSEIVFFEVESCFPIRLRDFILEEIVLRCWERNRVQESNTSRFNVSTPASQ